MEEFLIKSRKMTCKVCGREPSQIFEYLLAGLEFRMTPEEFVEKEEGTYNRDTQLFYCTECYIRIGMPLGVADKEIL